MTSGVKKSQLGSIETSQVGGTNGGKITRTVKVVFSGDTEDAINQAVAEAFAGSDLATRVAALEEETDGLVSGADPLSYYLLARG